MFVPRKSQPLFTVLEIGRKIRGLFVDKGERLRLVDGQPGAESYNAAIWKAEKTFTYRGVEVPLTAVRVVYHGRDRTLALAEAE